MIQLNSTQFNSVKSIKFSSSLCSSIQFSSIYNDARFGLTEWNSVVRPATVQVFIDWMEYCSHNDDVLF